MATIYNLGKSYLDMAEEERFTLIKGLRASRRIQKRTVKVSSSKAPRKAVKKKAPTAEDLLKNLTPEMAQALIKQLGG